MNIKTLMVALAAAMLVPALAPTAAADTAPCSSTTDMLAIEEGVAYGRSSSVANDGSEETRIPDALQNGVPYVLEAVTTDGPLLTFSVWEKTSDGCVQVARIDPENPQQNLPGFIADGAATYYLWVEDENDDPGSADFEAFIHA